MINETIKQLETMRNQKLAQKVIKGLENRNMTGYYAVDEVESQEQDADHASQYCCNQVQQRPRTIGSRQRGVIVIQICSRRHAIIDASRRVIARYCRSTRITRSSTRASRIAARVASRISTVTRVIWIIVVIVVVLRRLGGIRRIRLICWICWICRIN